MTFDEILKQVITLLSGEGGIGKSRLVQVLKDRLAREASMRVECQCSPYYQHTAFHPVVSIHRLRQEIFVFDEAHASVGSEGRCAPRASSGRRRRARGRVALRKGRR